MHPYGSCGVFEPPITSSERQSDAGTVKGTTARSAFARSAILEYHSTLGPCWPARRTRQDYHRAIGPCWACKENTVTTARSAFAGPAMQEFSGALAPLENAVLCGTLRATATFVLHVAAVFVHCRWVQSMSAGGPCLPCGIVAAKLRPRYGYGRQKQTTDSSGSPNLGMKSMVVCRESSLFLWRAPTNNVTQSWWCGLWPGCRSRVPAQVTQKGCWAGFAWPEWLWAVRLFCKPRETRRSQRQAHPLEQSGYHGNGQKWLPGKRRAPGSRAQRCSEIQSVFIT